MTDLTKYRSDLKSEYIRVGTQYYRFIVEISLAGKECGIFLRPWPKRAMKNDDVPFHEVPKYDLFHHETHPDYPYLFSLEGFVKTRLKIPGIKTPIKIYKWVGIESAG